MRRARRSGAWEWGRRPATPGRRQPGRKPAAFRRAARRHRYQRRTFDFAPTPALTPAFSRGSNGAASLRCLAGAVASRDPFTLQDDRPARSVRRSAGRHRCRGVRPRPCHGDGRTGAWPPDQRHQPWHLRGTAEEFCLLVTPCHHRDDLALDHGGPATTAWLAIAQCFAGPPAECCFSNLYRAVHDYRLLRDAALPRIVGRS